MQKHTLRKLRVDIYKRLLNSTCAHPECDSPDDGKGLSIEAHHIRPLYKGGYDKFWNLISLCWRCHRKKKLHSQGEAKLTELYVYKSMHELKILGFIMDEEEPEFERNYKIAIRKMKNITQEEMFLAENIKI